MKQQIIKYLNYLNLISILYLVASSIYTYRVQKIGFYAFFATYILEIILEKKWVNIQFDTKRIYYIVLAFFFFLAIIYLPFENSRKYTYLLLENRTSLFGFALVGFFGVNKEFKLNYFLNTFIISSIVAIAYLVFYRIGFMEFIHNPLRAELFTAERIKYVNSHMLFNFYLNVSLICVWFILTRSWTRTIWWKNYLYIGALTVILGFLSISEGRSGFAIGILLVLCFVFYEIWKRRKVMGLIAGLLIPFLFIGIASQQRRMSEKMLETEPRWFLWESAVSVIKEKPVLGFGISDAQEKFDVARTKYQTEDYRLNWINSKHLDSHDQYLQTTMEFGVFGLIILLFLYFYPIKIADKNKKAFTVLIIFLCAYQSVFDMFVTGPFAVLFGILMLLILSVENNIVKKKRLR
ncbi:MAG: O-antigen ligase family protein [Paludibacter sp.]